jgi:hypothetical protein
VWIDFFYAAFDKYHLLLWPPEHTVTKLVFSSIKFFASRGTSRTAVINYRKRLVTRILRKNLLTRRVNFLI